MGSEWLPAPRCFFVFWHDAGKGLQVNLAPITYRTILKIQHSSTILQSWPNYSEEYTVQLCPVPFAFIKASKHNKQCTDLNNYGCYRWSVSSCWLSILLWYFLVFLLIVVYFGSLVIVGVVESVCPLLWLAVSDSLALIRYGPQFCQNY